LAPRGFGEGFAAGFDAAFSLFGVELGFATGFAPLSFFFIWFLLVARCSARASA
jgi:hypothetical protein